MAEEQKTHTHVLEHGHHHSHAHTKAVLNRMSRAIGHMESIKRMIEDGRDCAEVLIQLSAVKSAINNTGKIILQDHIEHCIVDAVEHGDKEAIKELEVAIDTYKPKFHCRRQSGMNFGCVTVNGVNSNNILSVQQCVNIKEKINYGKRM